MSNILDLFSTIKLQSMVYCQHIMSMINCHTQLTKQFNLWSLLLLLIYAHTYAKGLNVLRLRAEPLCPVVELPGDRPRGIGG